MRGLLGVLGLALPAALSGCGGPPPAAHAEDLAVNVAAVLVVQVPPGTSRADLRAAPDPDARYPEGSRLVLVDLNRPADPPRPVSDGLAAAGAPTVAADGRSVLFAGRRAAGAPWSIWSWEPGARRPRALVERDVDCIDPGFLGGERIVFACAVDATGDGEARWALHTADRGGESVERITFGPGSAFAPTGLLDGRVLFVRRRPGAETTALFTVNPDGTLLEVVLGGHDDSIEYRPRQTDDGGIVFLASDASGGAPARLERAEFDRPRAGRSLVTPPGGLGERDRGVRSGEPTRGGGLLAAVRTGERATLAIARIDSAGATPVVVFDDPALDDIEAVPLAARRPPRGRPSPVDPDAASGSVVCYDSTRSDGVIGPPRGAFPARGMTVERARADGGIEALGRVPVAADGSFFIDVPADTPIRVVALDDAGRRGTESDWFWVRPGERRACFGCHESRDAAPANRAIAALAEAAVPVGLDVEGERR